MTNQSRHPLYRIWIQMRSRCRTPISQHKNYCGRGIKVCEKWDLSFEAFVIDIGPRPSLKHSVDRIDNDGNYEPSNCRWATQTEQTRNTRKNRHIETGGNKVVVAEFAEARNQKPNSITTQMKRGWTNEEIIQGSRLKQRRGKLFEASDAIVADRLAGMSIVEIWKKQGFDTGNISRELTRRGVKVKAMTTSKPEVTAKIAEMRSSGMLISEIAQKTGRTSSSVHAHIRKAGLSGTTHKNKKASDFS